MNKLFVRNTFLIFSSVVLLPSFFLLHGINENFGLIPGFVILHLFLKYIFIAIAVICFSFLLFRKLTKATIFCYSFLCCFFFFGAFHDVIKSLFSISIITSYTFLIPLICAFYILLFYLLKKSKKEFKSISDYFTLLMVVLLGWEIVGFTYNSISNKEKENNFGVNDKTIINHLNSKIGTEKPDIYFIVLDEYTSSKCLQEEFNYNNSELDSILIKNHFFISKDSRSNYNATPFSLSSSLNFNYLQPDLNNRILWTKLFIQGIESFKQNPLTPFLASKGYSIKNYGCFNLKNASTVTVPYFDFYYYGLFDNQTLLSKIKNDIWWNFTTKNIFTGEAKIPESYTNDKKYHLFRNKINYQKLVEELNANSNSPKFVYTHLMLPHEPYYLDSTGKEVSDTAIIFNSQNLKQAYLQQVIYTNSLLKKLIPMFTQKAKRNRVVVIEGDHGFREYGDNFSDKIFMNLNAYYFSDHDYSSLYDSISPVNSFRVVLNKYFGQSLPLLKDSSVLLIDPNTLQK